MLGLYTLKFLCNLLYKSPKLLTCNEFNERVSCANGETNASYDGDLLTACRIALLT